MPVTAPGPLLRGLQAALAGWGLLPAPRDNLGRDRGLGYVLPALPRSLADAFPGQGTFLSSRLRGHHHAYQRSVQTDCPGHPDGVPVPRRRRARVKADWVPPSKKGSIKL